MSAYVLKIKERRDGAGVALLRLVRGTWAVDIALLVHGLRVRDFQRASAPVARLVLAVQAVVGRPQVHQCLLREEGGRGQGEG